MNQACEGQIKLTNQQLLIKNEARFCYCIARFSLCSSPRKNGGAKTNRHPNSSYVSRQHQILCGLEHPDVSLPESLCVCIIIMSQRKHWFYEKRFHPKPPSFIVFPPSQDPLFLTGSIRFSHNYETKKKTHRAMGNLQG